MQYSQMQSNSSNRACHGDDPGTKKLHGSIVDILCLQKDVSNEYRISVDRLLYDSACGGFTLALICHDILQ